MTRIPERQCSLLPSNSVLVTFQNAEQHQLPSGPSTAVIDWEYSQFGHHALDLGQMIADLIERKHFKGAESAMWTLQGFIDGYGPITEEMAFRTAIHAGVMLILWYNRRPPWGPLDGTTEQITSVMTLGRDLIIGGHQRDKEWLMGTALCPLFHRDNN